MIDFDETVQLSNGKTIEDPTQAAIMSHILEVHPESNPDYQWDDSGLSYLFAECCADRLCYCPEVERWMAWDGGRWIIDKASTIAQARMDDFMRVIRLYANEELEGDLKKAYKEFVDPLGSYDRRRKILLDAEDCRTIPLEKFDENPYLINCKNGTFDLSDFTFREASPENRLTLSTNFEFTQDFASLKFPRWNSFITEVCDGEKDKEAYLQRALGYSLFGRPTEDCMFVLHGTKTRNGKSTLVNTVAHLLGDYATEVSPDFISRGAKKNSEAASPILASLDKARMVAMNEPDESERLDEQFIKQLTGGEPVKARGLYRDPITYQPHFTMWLSCNDYPPVHDMTLFTSDRMRVIDFNHYFGGSERDNNLKHLFQTQQAMQYIFYWLVQGYAQWIQHGLSEPECVKQSILLYSQETDMVSLFLTERTRKIETGKVKGSILYDSYRKWCHDNGQNAVFPKRFHTQVAKTTTRYSRDNTVWYSGIELIA